MSKQPQALRLAGILADAVEDPMIETHAEVSKALCIHAVTELRRQHALIEEMREALQNMIEAAGALQNTCGAIHGDTPEDSDTFTHDKWAEDFLRETASESLPVLAKAEAQQ